MEAHMLEFILDLLRQGRDLTLATIRSDGYPQATTVSYAHDGLAIFVAVGKHSQKAENMRRSNKVSLTINKDYRNWNEIQGLSMAATAEFLERPEDIDHAGRCFLERFPEAEKWSEAASSGEVTMLRLRPQVISVLDYTKGFGHTELVNVQAA